VCWCAVKKLHTHSLILILIVVTAVNCKVNWMWLGLISCAKVNNVSKIFRVFYNMFLSQNTHAMFLFQSQRFKQSCRPIGLLIIIIIMTIGLTATAVHTWHTVRIAKYKAINVTKKVIKECSLQQILSFTLQTSFELWYVHNRLDNCVFVLAYEYNGHCGV